LDRIDDDAALRAKVDEALSVYDDYMKNRPSGAEGGPNGALKEDEAGKEDSGEGAQA
jgi:polyadenylate-binding protein